MKLIYLISLLFMSFPEIKILGLELYFETCQYTSVGVNDDELNVLDFGAVGDGIHDDTDAIEKAIQHVKSVQKKVNGLGTKIYFPRGVYLISRTLKVPPQTNIYGSGGTFNQEHYGNREDLYKHQPVVIKLADNSNCNMIGPDYSSEIFSPLESVIIEGIALDGNKFYQENGIYNGIFVKDLPSEIRPNFIVRNVFIFNVRGNGFYFGRNISEYVLENIFSVFNDLNGFYFEKNEDVNLTRVGAGGNKSNGFYIQECSAFRFINTDAWVNQMNGIKIESSGGLKFTVLQCDNNFQNGLYIKNSAMLNFISATFQSNSRLNWQYQDRPGKFTPEFSEVLLDINSSEGFGSYGVIFCCCQFGCMDLTRKTSYGIYDASVQTRSNLMVACKFIEGSFTMGAVNRAVQENYQLSNNSGGLEGESDFVNPVSFVHLIANNSDNIFYLKKEHQTLFINTHNSDCIIKLPMTSEIPLGKHYEIIKESDENIIRVESAQDKNINEGLSEFISGEKSWEKLTIINAGDKWIILQ